MPKRDQTFDGFEALGRVSGLGREEVKRLWEQAQENHKRLLTCVGPHQFTPKKDSDRIHQEYVCSLCQGVITKDRKFWYDQGLKHGQTQSEDG